MVSFIARRTCSVAQAKPPFSAERAPSCRARNIDCRLVSRDRFSLGLPCYPTHKTFSKVFVVYADNSGVV